MARFIVDEAPKPDDDPGHVVGRIVPSADLSQYEPLLPQSSAGEIQPRLPSNEKSYTTEEVLAHLGKL